MFRFRPSPELFIPAARKKLVTLPFHLSDGPSPSSLACYPPLSLYPPALRPQPLTFRFYLDPFGNPPLL